MSKKVLINEGFFDNWTPEMAWVLGISYTDGYFGKTNSKGIRRFYIAQKDIELLEKIKALMQSEHKILMNTQSNRKDKIYYFSFTNNKLFNSLIRLGVSPKKSLTVKFPQDIPYDCLRHFLRGCWDGDGSFYYENDDPRKVRADFVNGSYEFIRNYVDKLIELSKIEHINIYRKHKKNQCYHIKLSPQDTIKMFPLFYKGVSETVYLAKKYEKLKKSHDILTKR